MTDAEYDDLVQQFGEEVTAVVQPHIRPGNMELVCGGLAGLLASSLKLVHPDDRWSLMRELCEAIQQRVEASLGNGEPRH